MTDNLQPPVYSPPVYQQPVYTQPVYVPPVRTIRPPLTARAKRGAVIAGIVGFLMLSLGWTLIIIPAVIAVFGAFVLFLFSAVGAGNGRSSTSEFFDNVLGDIPIALWATPMIISAVVGVALMIGGILASRGILKAHGVKRATGVTWAAFAIAVVAYWIVSSILGTIFALVGSFGGSYDGGYDTMFWVLISLSGLGSIVLTAVVGWLSWWWMAHAMRPAAGE